MTKTFGYDDYRDVLDEFVSRVQEAFGERLVSLVLYGSVVRGEAGPESDADLLLVLEDASPVYFDRLQPLLPIL